MSVAVETRIGVAVPSAAVTWIVSPVRAEMKPSISGPSVSPLRSAGTSPTTVIGLALCCADTPPHAGMTSMASASEADVVVEIVLIALLLELRSPHSAADCSGQPCAQMNGLRYG